MQASFSGHDSPKQKSAAVLKRGIIRLSFALALYRHTDTVFLLMQIRQPHAAMHSIDSEGGGKLHEPQESRQARWLARNHG
jgi:hypothetical protein